MNSDIHIEPSTTPDEIEPAMIDPQPATLPFFARRLRCRLQVKSGVNGGHVIKAAGRG